MLKKYIAGFLNTVLRWFIRKVHRAIVGLFEFVHNYTLEIILMSFISLGFCWAVGYFANAIYGMKFELASCWAGFSAIGGAGVMAAVKYCMDSWKNTPEGVTPNQGMSASQRFAAAGAAALNEFSKQTEKIKTETNTK